MTRSESGEHRMNIKGWTVAIGAIAVWFCLFANSAEAQQQIQIPETVLAQVLGADRAERIVPSAEQAQAEAMNLVAHRMRADFEDQLVAGVSRPSVELEVHFDFDSDAIHTESVEDIEAAAVVMTNHFPDSRFRVAGYTDAAGSADYNQELSERRAMAVWRQLVDEYGVTPDRLESVGFGEDSESQAETEDAAASAKRRRVELQILRTEARML